MSLSRDKPSPPAPASSQKRKSVGRSLPPAPPHHTPPSICHPVWEQSDPPLPQKPQYCLSQLSQLSSTTTTGDGEQHRRVPGWGCWTAPAPDGTGMGMLGSPNPTESILPLAMGTTKAQSWFPAPVGPSCREQGRVPAGVPTQLCPTTARTSPGAQPSQRGARFLPRCNTPLPAACVTPLPAQRAGAATRPRPGLASAMSSSPPWLLANPARGSRSAEEGHEATAASPLAGAWPPSLDLENRREMVPGGFKDISVPFVPWVKHQQSQHHPAQVGLGTESGHEAAQTSPGNLKGAGWTPSLGWWRKEGPKQAQRCPHSQGRESGRDFSQSMA